MASTRGTATVTTAEGVTAFQLVDRAPHHAEERWVSPVEITAMAREEVVEATAIPCHVLEAGGGSEVGVAGRPQLGITCPSDAKRSR
jgi:hypothetical protein